MVWTGFECSMAFAQSPSLVAYTPPVPSRPPCICRGMAITGSTQVVSNLVSTLDLKLPKSCFRTWSLAASNCPTVGASPPSLCTALFCRPSSAPGSLSTNPSISSCCPTFPRFGWSSSMRAHNYLPSVSLPCSVLISAYLPYGGFSLCSHPIFKKWPLSRPQPHPASAVFLSNPFCAFSRAWRG